jgi:predicted ribonuclease YlaK
MEKEGLIKIMPIDVAKGVTFMKSVVIVDEFQDMDYDDFRTILTRLGDGSKMIFCGSKQQIHKSIGKNSCLYDALKLEESGLVGFKTLTANHRNPILTEIIKYLENE